MKKLFALLLIAPMLFTACGDEEEEKPYFNPVEGTWVYSLPEYNSTQTRIFTKKFEAFVIIKNGNEVINDTLGTYAINSDWINYLEIEGNSGTKHQYAINGDTLILYDLINNWKMKFLRKK